MHFVKHLIYISQEWKCTFICWLTQIHVKWYKVHKNLDWGILNLARVPLWRQLNGSCSFYKARLDTPAEDCTLLEMKLRFNFSIYGDGSGMDKGKKYMRKRQFNFINLSIKVIFALELLEEYFTATFPVLGSIATSFSLFLS